MKTRENKTAEMLIHKIGWGDVEKELKITKPTLTSWRKSGDPNKNEAIDYSVKKIIERGEGVGN